MTTGYAVQALSLLAQRPEEYFLVRDIAEVTGIPAPYLSKVAQRLVDLGILDSKRGYRGGVRLAIPPNELTIERIDDALDMGEDKTRCLLGGVECSDARACPVHEFWKSTRAQIKARLSGLTLAEVTKFEQSRPGFIAFAPERRERKTPKKYKKRQKPAAKKAAKKTAKAAKPAKKKVAKKGR